MNLNLPNDSLTDKIGVNVVGDFDNFIQGGGSEQNGGNGIVSLPANPIPYGTNSVREAVGLNYYNFLLNALSNIYNTVPSFNNNNMCILNKNIPVTEQKDKADGPNDPKNMINAVEKGNTNPNDPFGINTLHMNAILQYLKLLSDQQTGMNKAGGAMPGAMPGVLNNNPMGMGMGMQPGMGMGMQPGVAMGQSGVRDAVSQHVGNASGMRIVPSSLASSLSSMSSASTSANLPISECTLNASRGKCRRPTCFREIPGVANSNCLPRRGVSQVNGMCPPQYNRGRGNSCVPKSEKQLRNLQKGNMAPAMPRPRGRPRGGLSPPRTMCAQVNDMAKQAQNDYVTANCQAPGCTIKQMKNGYLQCAKSRN